MHIDLSPAWISLKVTLTATVIIFFLGIFAAWQMSRYNGKAKGLLDSLLTLPLVLPPTVAGFGILLLIGRRGPIGRFFETFDVTIVFSWYAAVIAAVVVAFPLMYKTARGAFEQVDSNMLNAARTLGATEWQVFWRVSVPLAWPGIAAATALSFARALGEFGATLMVAGSIPGKTQTIPIAIYFATQSSEWQVALVWVVIIFMISLVVMLMMNHWERSQQDHLKGRGLRAHVEDRHSKAIK